MNRSFVYVMFGLLLGVVLGTFSYYSFPDRATAAEIAKDMSLVSTVFLKLIKMIIGPLVLSTLVVGIGHMGDAATVGPRRRKNHGVVRLRLDRFAAARPVHGRPAQARRRHRDRRSVNHHRQPDDAGVQHRQLHRSHGADLAVQVARRWRNPADRGVFRVRRHRDHGPGRARKAAARARRRRLAHDAQHHQLCDENCADRGLRLGGFGDHQIRPRHPRSISQNSSAVSI